MRVSAKSDYALRALIEIARDDRAAAISAEELGRRQDIPHGFLQAILADLRRAGVVISQRGQSGGWRLARPADRGLGGRRDPGRRRTAGLGLRPAPRGGRVQRRRPRCSSTSGSPPAARCATSSSTSPSRTSPLGELPGEVTSRTADEDAWQPHWTQCQGWRSVAQPVHERAAARASRRGPGRAARGRCRRPRSRSACRPSAACGAAGRCAGGRRRTRGAGLQLVAADLEAVGGQVVEDRLELGAGAVVRHRLADAASRGPLAS